MAAPLVPREVESRGLCASCGGPLGNVRMSSGDGSRFCALPDCRREGDRQRTARARELKRMQRAARKRGQL